MATTLEEAISDGDLAGVKSLVAVGADVNQKSTDGMDLLSYALDYQQVEIAQFLLQAGADINGNGTVCTPLQAAIDNGAYDVIFTLIERGADVNLKGTEEEKYPLHQLAWGYLDPIFFQKMIEAGADVTLTDGEGQTAYDIMHAHLADNAEHASAIHEILELISPPNKSS